MLKAEDEIVTRPDFEDQFTKIDNGILELKLYYIPLANSLNLKIEKIKKIKIKNQSNSYENQWGTYDLNTFWAWDIKRNKRPDAIDYFNVKIEVEGERLKKGFTVKDIHGFLTAIRKYLKVEDIEFEE